MDVAFWGWNRAWLDPDFRAWNIEEYLGAIRCPVLVIQGEDDEYGTLAQVDAIEAGCGGPVRRLVLPDCGHSPHREQPEATLGPWPTSCAECRVDGAPSTMTEATTIRVHVPSMLRDCCAGASELPLSAASVRAALDQIEERYPSLYRSVCDETGAVRRHVNLFVNADHMRDLDGLDTPLRPGDVVTILPAVSGG